MKYNFSRQKKIFAIIKLQICKIVRFFIRKRFEYASEYASVLFSLHFYKNAEKIFFFNFLNLEK